MAKDDYMVIVYKILSYLYECLKAGKSPDPADYCWNCDMFQIPQAYWESIMEELINNGYIKGAAVIRPIVRSGPAIKTGAQIAITLASADYLENNSTMSKARAFLGSSFQSVLSGIVGALA